MPAPRPPKRSRTRREVTVVHFEKPRDLSSRRATRPQTQIHTESQPEDEDTAVTAPGEDTDGVGVRAEPSAPREYLVDVPEESGGRYRAERVRRLLWHQQPGHPFPMLSEGDVTELACFGRFLFEIGRFDDAQLVLEGLVASGIMDPFPYTMLGTVYLAQRDLNRALALFEAALALNPKDLAAHVYRAEIRLRQGRPELAGPDLRYALEFGDPDDPFTVRAAQLKKLVRRARQARS
jgi:tetratricopeptide repeat protein